MEAFCGDLLLTTSKILSSVLNLGRGPFVSTMTSLLILGLSGVKSETGLGFLTTLVQLVSEMLLAGSVYDCLALPVVYSGVSLFPSGG